jgi:Trypsin
MFPSLAFILDKRGEVLGQCTGTVVAPTLILTAGHCAENIETGVVHEPSGYSVVTGNVDWAVPERQILSVSRVIPYPGFLRSVDYGDAALLELSTPTTAPAIGLATDLAGMPAGTAALIAGWGVTHYEQELFTEQLQWADTAVQGPGWCESHASEFSPEGELCAINPPSDETGACLGDSGGPLLATWPPSGPVVEIGITIRVNAECLTTHPTVFTRSDLIASWVNEWIEALEPSPPTTPGPLPSPLAPPAAPKPSPAAVSPVVAPPGPPNEPGYYVTRPSRARKIVIHVSGDGTHIVGLRIKTPVRCQHGYVLPLEDSFLSYAYKVTITNHIARGTLATGSDSEFRVGHIGLYVRFTAPGSLEGRLRVHVPTRRRKVGLCSGTLKFTAKT